MLGASLNLGSKGFWRLFEGPSYLQLIGFRVQGTMVPTDYGLLLYDTRSLARNPKLEPWNFI